MSLTPIDIHNKEFKSARLGGYNEEDVDSFLDVVAEELEAIEAEHESLKAELENARKKLAEFEEMQSSLQSALITASKSAEDVRNQSSREAGELLENARKESEAIIRAAQEQASRIIAQSENEGQMIEAKFNKLKEIKKQYLDSLKRAADAQLSEIRSLEEQDRQYNITTEKKVLQDAPVSNPVQNAPVQKEPVPAAVEQSVAAVPPQAPVPPSPQEPVGGVAIEEASTQGNLLEAGEVAAENPPVQQKSEENAQASVEAEGKGSVSEQSPAVNGTEVVHGRMKENSRPVIVEEMRPIASPPPNAQAVATGSEISREETQRVKVATRTEDLVEEILGMDTDEGIFEELEDIDEEDNGRGKRKLGRKERKNKNKFWE